MITGTAMRGFTLIEMLVVLSILMLLSSLILVNREQSAMDAVAEDAIQLQTVLERARALSMSTGRSHGVVFHIENAGDGSVLKNHSILNDEGSLGGHWYTIIGPDISNRNLRSTKRPPKVSHNSVNGERSFFALHDYMEAVKDAQVGPKFHISHGVRFLALTDYDSLHYSESHSSYPRPWFGFFDDTNKTLYPWGAYNPEIDATFTEPNTGLDYEGLNEPIPYDASLDTNVYPSQVWGRLFFEFDYASGVGTGCTAKYPSQVGVTDKSVLYHNGKSGEYVGPETTMFPGKPYPVINGYAVDYMILFNPNGSASIARGHCRGEFLHKSRDNVIGHNNPGMETMVDQTGGYAITLCRDVDPNDQDLYKQQNPKTGQAAYNKFSTVEDAFESITPFVQVFIDRATGMVEVRNVGHPNLRVTANDMLQHDPYPRGIE